LAAAAKKHPETARTKKARHMNQRTFEMSFAGFQQKKATTEQTTKMTRYQTTSPPVVAWMQMNLGLTQFQLEQKREKE
jgi:hypothetical protein